MKKFKELFRASTQDLSYKKSVLIAAFLVFVSAAFFPSDPDFYKNQRRQTSGEFVHFVENYLRFSNTALQIVLPVITKDAVGFMQSVNLSLATTLSTHTLKFALNDLDPYGKMRLGQRPKSTTSCCNMPSGHSSMVSCAATFLIRRYGTDTKAKKFMVFFVVLVTLLTMTARVFLDMHTISATIAGATLGFICAYLLTSARNKKLPFKFD